MILYFYSLVMILEDEKFAPSGWAINAPANLEGRFTIYNIETEDL